MLPVRDLLVLLVLVSVVEVTWGYGTGAPTSVCDTMMPGHGVEQTATNTHTLTLGDGAMQYEEGVDLTITISGTFKGTFIQARKADDSSDTTSYGTFQVNSADNVQVISCSTGSNNAVTHSSTALKTNLQVTWSPPGGNQGNLKLVATVAEEKATWWRNTESIALTYKAKTNNAVTSAPVSTLMSLVLASAVVLLL
jgi:hypothetical protein